MNYKEVDDTMTLLKEFSTTGNQFYRLVYKILVHILDEIQEAHWVSMGEDL